MRSENLKLIYTEYYPQCCRSTAILHVAEAWQHFATTITSVKASTIRGRFHLRTFQKHRITSAIVFSAKITQGNTTGQDQEL